jgi:hypothetical protein
MNEEILKRLDALGAKLGVTAQYLWGVLIKQARVEMWTDTAIVCVALVAAGASAWMVRWAHKEDTSDSEAIVIVGSIVGLVASGIAIGYAVAAITEGANPEYWALKQVMSAVAQ